jgi:hypothetical protein
LVKSARFASDKILEQHHVRAITTQTMGVQKKTRKFGAVKRVIGGHDARLKKNILKEEKKAKEKEVGDGIVRDV